MRVPVYLDYLMANQLIAAADTRQQLLEAHALRMQDMFGEVPDELSRAIVDTIAGELAIRAAFDVLRDVVGDPDIYGERALAYADRMDEYQTRGA